MNVTNSIITRTDEEILALRAKRDAALQTPELRAMREEVQRLFGERAETSRRAANYARHVGFSGLASRPALTIDTAREAARADVTGEAYATLVREDRHAAKARALATEYEDEEGAAFRAWLRASGAYEKARKEALRAVGLLDETELEVPIGPTSTECASAEAYERRLLDWPPVGWGTSSATVAERVERWRARPKADRRSDHRPRIDPQEGKA